MIVDDLNTKYPNIAAWVQEGWIEIGQTDFSQSFIRVLDEGGMIWESRPKYLSLSDALDEAESIIAAWFEENA